MVDWLDWENVKLGLKVGTMVRGIVRCHELYGILVEIPGFPFRGLVQITDFKDEGRMTVGEYPALGSNVDACVLGFKDIGQQIWLGLRPSQLKGEAIGVSTMGRSIMILAICSAIALIAGVTGALLAYQFLPSIAGGAFGFAVGFLPGTCVAIWAIDRLDPNSAENDTFYSTHG